MPRVCFVGVTRQAIAIGRGDGRRGGEMRRVGEGSESGILRAARIRGQGAISRVGATHLGPARGRRVAEIWLGAVRWRRAAFTIHDRSFNCAR
jgi:hypothetical protein